MLVRILTAICLIIAVVWATASLNGFHFWLGSGVVFVLAGLEWTNICQYRHWLAKTGFVLLLLIIGVILWLGTNFGIPGFNLKSLMLIGTFFWIIPFYWICTYRQTPPALLKNRHILALIGLGVLSLAWLALNEMRIMSGPTPVFILLLLVCSCDSFAYFVGRFLGKTPLAPYVSPKKTWGGFWGGVIGAMLVAVISVWLMEIPVSRWPLWLAMALITVLLSVVGDLFESLVKRIAGIKDSGKLLPGHGGVLDRIDSLISTLPFFSFAYLLLQGH